MKLEFVKLGEKLIRVIQELPQTLFKYLNLEIYHNYVRDGHLRLGVSAFYRDQYEKGVGYADINDGVRETVFPEVGQKARSAGRYYLFCLSQSYSYYEHVNWYRRRDCNYDCCLALDGKSILKMLVQSVKEQLGSRFLALGKCEYGNHLDQTGELSGNLYADAFLKPESYAHEDEYRLAVFLSENDQSHFLNLRVPDFIKAV